MKRSKTGIAVLAVLAVAISLFVGIQYFGSDAENAGLVKLKLETMNLDSLWYAALYTHIAGSMVALALGWAQFLPKLRRSRPNAHRAMGKLYAAGVAIGGLSGAYMAFYATGGWVSSAGFLALALLWLYSMVRGVRAIVRDGNRFAHGNWMILNYALTFAAVMLRIYVPLSDVLFGEDGFVAAYRAIAWLCWVPNVFFAVWLVKRRGKRAPRANVR